MDGLAAKRVFAIRINSGVAKVDKRYIAFNSAGRGVADILAFPKHTQNFCDYQKGLRLTTNLADALFSLEIVSVLWLEIKSATGRQSPEQASFEKMVIDYGQDYLLARSWDDVEAWLKEHGL
jgi:hypothetical protein